MLPPKLNRGDTFVRLFDLWNQLIDYLREIRLVAGPGIRINRLPAGITIEALQQHSANNNPPAYKCWSPVVRQNYRVDYYGTMPWAVLFYNAQVVFHGVFQNKMLPLYLTNAAVSSGTLYIYALDINFNDIPVLRWSTSPLWDHTAGNTYDYRPIRYIGKITITDGNFLFDGLPTDTVRFQGGFDDSVRVVAQWTTRTWNQDLSETIRPTLIINHKNLVVDIDTGGFSSFGEGTHRDIDLSDYSSFDSELNVFSDGSIYPPYVSVIGGHNTRRPIARLGKEDSLGFRPVYINPEYIAYHTDYGVSFNGSSFNLNQKYINASGEIASIERTSVGPSGSAKIDIYAVFDYIPESGILSTPRLVLSTESIDPPRSDMSRLTYTVGEIVPTQIGVARVRMFYPLITPGFAILRAKRIYSDLSSEINTLKNRATYLEIRVTNLENRVTALENK